MMKNETSTNYKKIVDDVLDQINHGQLRKGDKLPTELCLATQFDVSRTCVREAIKSLEVMGIVQSIQGSGSYITNTPELSINRPICALFALSNGTLENVLDSRFHNALIRMSHNSLIKYIYTTLASLMDIYRERVLEKTWRRDENALTRAGHFAICQALKDRDEAAAADAIYNHLALIGPYRECLIKQNEEDEKTVNFRKFPVKTFDLPSNSNYGDQPIPIAFPDNWDVHVSKIHGYDTPALTEAQIAEKIHAAIGAKPISEGAAGKKSAVIIIDDITRPTPCEPIAKAVIAELRAAGVPKENIWFIIALGTHGVMYRTEFVRKLGEEIVENYEVHNHNLFFNHVFVGNTTNNVPVEINADVMSADYKIAIGTTMAHSYYGFSGGAKCILPGVSSLRTIMRNHSFTTTTEFNMGNPHTLMRSDAEQAARMMGLDFKVDAILNGHAEICNLFAGDFEAEERQAAAYAAGHYAAKFVPDCDIVIANNYFKPAEANCAYTPEVIASLKDGGSFVLAANSPFGPCVHFLYDKWGHSAPGGMMWSGCYTKGKNMAHAVVFAEHTVKGMRDPWYIDEHSGAEYVRTWDDALRILDDGAPKKVVLYPTAECQVLDNSKDFYKR